MGSCSSFAVLIRDERRTEFQLTTASGKNTSQPSKTPTLALGPSGNPWSTSAEVPAGTSQQHGCPAVRFLLPWGQGDGKGRKGSSRGWDKGLMVDRDSPPGQETNVLGTQLTLLLCGMAELFSLFGSFKCVCVCICDKISNVAQAGLKFIIFLAPRMCH